MKLAKKSIIASTLAVFLTAGSFQTVGFTQSTGQGGGNKKEQAVHDEKSGEILELLKQVVEQMSNKIDNGSNNSSSNSSNNSSSLPLPNKPEDKEDRQGGPSPEVMSENVLLDEDQGVAPLNEALKNYREKYLMTDVYVLAGQQTYPKQAEARLAALGAAAAGVSDLAYSRSNKSMERLDTYIKALEESGDLKTSVDVNSLLLVEMTQQINELLRVQASMAHLSSKKEMLRLRSVQDSGSSITGFLGGQFNSLTE